ncbi:Retrovirus-related Pol polyprotein from transposon 17.6, partial [Mucuna pruriens]
MKLLAVGIIYPILDNQCVILVQVVRKKIGMTVFWRWWQVNLITVLWMAFQWQINKRPPSPTHLAHSPTLGCRLACTINKRPPSPTHLAHSPTLGCRLACTTLQAPSRESCIKVFIDDFTVYDHSFGAFLESLSRVLDRCIETNLVLNFEKCHFMVTNGIMLGNLVSNRDIEVDKAKIDIIDSLGHVAFYRRFIQNFIKIALPLSKLLQQDVAPKRELPFELLCDAFNLALGVVLGQRVGKHSHVITYVSRTLDLA